MRVLPGDIWVYSGRFEVDTYKVINVNDEVDQCKIVSTATAEIHDSYPISYFKMYDMYWKLIKRYPRHTKLGKVLYK